MNLITNLEGQNSLFSVACWSVITKVTDEVFWCDKWSSTLLNNLEVGFVERDFYHKESSVTYSGRDSCSKWWQESSPEASKPPAYIEPKLGASFSSKSTVKTPSITKYGHKLTVSAHVALLPKTGYATHATWGLSGYQASWQVADSREPVLVAGLSLNK